MQDRIEWIDCAKLIAIIAVAVDHCNGFLYTKPHVAVASYYSVSLFVLLAGISIWNAYTRGKEVSFAAQFRRVQKILIAYTIATFIGTYIITRRFDLKTYMTYLLNFDIQGPYYYLVFFIQLIMVAPILLNWCRFVNCKKCKWVLHLGTIGFLGWFAYSSINYTYILPVHGGGKYLGGGYLCNLILFGYGIGE